MGKRGPPKQPTALKIATGNPSRRPLNKAEPKPTAGTPACPRWLKGEARRCWREIVPELKRMGVLTKIERKALTRYCQTWARWQRAERYLGEHGDTVQVVDDKGRVKYVQQRPEVAIANKTATLLLRLEQEFGMTPASRPAIQVRGGTADDDDLAAFAKRKNA